MWLPGKSKTDVADRGNVAVCALYRRKMEPRSASGKGKWRENFRRNRKLKGPTFLLLLRSRQRFSETSSSNVFQLTKLGTSASGILWTEIVAKLEKAFEIDVGGHVDGRNLKLRAAVDDGQGPVAPAKALWPRPRFVFVAFLEVVKGKRGHQYGVCERYE